jgi:hypothetical protein
VLLADKRYARLRHRFCEMRCRCCILTAVGGVERGLNWLSLSESSTLHTVCTVFSYYCYCITTCCNIVSSSAPLVYDSTTTLKHVEADLAEACALYCIRLHEGPQITPSKEVPHIILLRHSHMIAGAAGNVHLRLTATLRHSSPGTLYHSASF